MKEYRVAKMRISLELLKEVLGLPPDTQIRGAESNTVNGVLVLYIEHPDLPLLTEGLSLPVASPEIRLHTNIVMLSADTPLTLTTKEFHGWDVY